VQASPSDRITTVVISLNRRDDLLKSLPRHHGPVILVDNGSTDGTVEAVRGSYPKVEVIELPSNIGAAARNIGVERASTPYVVFADDDSWWAAGARDRLVALFDTHPRLVLVAARILVGPQNRLDPASAEMAASPLPWRPDQPGRPVLGFVACGAAVRREAFLEVGGFDPVVFFPGEEERVALDLAASGWDLAYVPEVVAHHHPSAVRSTSSARERLILRNGILTAVMRRPWRVVARRCWASASAGAVGRSAVAATVPRLPAALRSRKRLPRELEDRLAILSNT
jgi:GT2 family glycosyltransferase